MLHASHCVREFVICFINFPLFIEIDCVQSHPIHVDIHNNSLFSMLAISKLMITFRMLDIFKMDFFQQVPWEPSTTILASIAFIIYIVFVFLVHNHNHFVFISSSDTVIVLSILIFVFAVCHIKYVLWKSLCIAFRRRFLMKNMLRLEIIFLSNSRKTEFDDVFHAH